MRDHLDAFPPVAIAVVTFAPVAELDAYRRALDLPFPVLSDVDRGIYTDLDVGRTSWRRVYNPGTLRLYGRLLREGRRLRRPIDDTRQLGADVVIDRRGRLAAVFRPPTPDSRPRLPELIEAVQRAS